MSESASAFLGRPRSKTADNPDKKINRDKKSQDKKPPKNSPRPARPPVRIDPGPGHELLAALGLKVVEKIAGNHGLQLDLGEVKKVEDYVSAAGANENGPQPVEIGARLIAHLMHRLPGAKRVAKKFEGNDKKSGILTDLGVLLYSLAMRNEDILFDAGEDAIGKVFSKKADPNSNGHADVIDLGKVNPSVVHNKHMEE